MSESTTIHTRRCLQHLRLAWQNSSPTKPFCPSDRFPPEISDKSFEEFSTEQQLANHLKRAAKGSRSMGKHHRKPKTESLVTKDSFCKMTPPTTTPTTPTTENLLDQEEESTTTVSISSTEVDSKIEDKDSDNTEPTIVKRRKRRCSNSTTDLNSKRTKTSNSSPKATTPKSRATTLFGICDSLRPRVKRKLPQLRMRRLDEFPQHKKP